MNDTKQEVTATSEHDTNWRFRFDTVFGPFQQFNVSFSLEATLTDLRNHVTGDGANQGTVYSQAAEGVVESVLKGYNGCVMCYGQTGTGKTYTMMGEHKEGRCGEVRFPA